MDEAMIPFKGRSSLKQYMPKKPVRRGIKVWALADTLNGYIANFQVYTGKQRDSTEKGLGAKVVKHLTAPCVNSCRHVYFANFFTGVDLLLDLQRSGCGTVRINQKGFPCELKPMVKKGMKERGDSKTVQSVQSKNLTVSVWQDNKPVTVVATNSDPTVEEQVSRKQRDGSSIAVSCPQSIVLYNTNMGGVDNNNQLRWYYHVRLKCRKFYKHIFWFLFDVAIVNSFILCKHFTHLGITDLKSFRKESDW